MSRNSQNLLSIILTGIVALAALIFSGSFANAQTSPALKLRFAFDDDGSVNSTNTPSDTSLGSEVSVALAMLSKTGSGTNLHGAAGSGVAGLTNPNRALNLSSNTTQGAAGNFAAITNSALGFGSVTNFAVTMWMKQTVSAVGTTILGRMFYLGNSTNATDVNVANSIGLKWQDSKNLYFYINGIQETATFASDLPLNSWIFVAMAYDGTNVTLYKGTETTPATLVSTTATAGQIVQLFGSTACLFVGNNHNGNRAFPGFVDDFRFYTGTGENANFIESVRQAAAGPSGLVAVPNDSVVALTWNALPGATSYNVKRATTSGGPYTTISTAGVVTGTSYSDTTAVNGTQYYYVVSATSAAGESANSATEASATPSVPPSAPMALSATPGSYQVVLTWSAPDGATSYNVKRSTTSGSETTATNVTTTTFTDTGLVNGVTYYYVVSALNPTLSESANSTETSATPVGPPPAPSGLAAFGAGIQEIGLSWNAVPLATSYNVYRDTSGGGTFATKVSTDGAVTTTGFTDATVSDSLTYFYKVSAVNVNGESPKSATVSSSGMTPKLRFDFSDTGATTTDSFTGAKLNMLNGSSVATDYHGAAGSGVAGAGKTLDFSSNRNNSPASGPVAITTNNTALNFGTLSNFTVTFWVKPSYDFYSPAPGAADLTVSNNPRLFLLSPANYTDYPAAVPSSQPGLYMKINSYDTMPHHGQLKVFLGGGASTTEYVTPENSFVSAVGLWSFVAITFDGGALKVYSATTTNSANLILNVATNIPPMGFTNVVGGNLLLGNNGALAKGIAGWMSDFRLYSGAGGSDFVENVRLLSANPLSGISAVGGDNQVTLNWTGLGSASSYNIKRATASGGPYMTLSTPGSVTGTSFTDFTAVNNTTYYYVISAATPYGESANSVEASATASCTPPPVVVNDGPTCAGGTLNLTASTVTGATYNWTGPNGFSSSEQNPSIPNVTAAASGVYSLTVTVGGCTSAPAMTTVLVSSTPTPTVANNGPLCSGSTLNLTASTVVGATYSWTGPNGFTSSEQNPSIPNTTSDATGIYTVTATVGGCTSPAGTTIAVVNQTPAAPTAGNNGLLTAGSTLNLTASTVDGAVYNWTGPNGFTSTAQNPSILNVTTNASGSYSVTATVGTCTSPAGTTTVMVNPVLDVTLSFQLANGIITLSWPTGTLLSSTNMDGPWDIVVGAVPPSYATTTTGPQQFFRVKVE
jgi:fibronectin type 3 domain-containing protein